MSTLGGEREGNPWEVDAGYCSVVLRRISNAANGLPSYREYELFMQFAMFVTTLDEYAVPQLCTVSQYCVTFTVSPRTLTRSWGPRNHRDVVLVLFHWPVDFWREIPRWVHTCDAVVLVSILAYVTGLWGS